ncbi:MAG: histidine ammonia-lyase [Terriglobia bacterium]|nr:MAG: histidine ammonia-lyase [Terriglobia bacterium]
MAGNLELGAHPLSLEDVERVARSSAEVTLSTEAHERIAAGRARLEQLMARGERIYGVNTGVGGNQGFALDAEDTELLQHNLLRQLSCATGAPLPLDVVRAAMLLRLATFATGASAVRGELVDALAGALNRGITPVVPRYGSVGASGDLMPSAYVARVLVGMGEAEFAGRRLSGASALDAAGLRPIALRPKEALALINGTTAMTAIASLLWIDANRVLRALLGAVALSVEALLAPSQPFDAWVHEKKGHPGQIAVAAYLREMLAGSANVTASSRQSCYSLRCSPQGLGPAWEELEDARGPIEREINSANDNPLIDPETGILYQAGNFYGGHMARLLDGWKLDFAVMANWGNALMAVLVDPRFNFGLPANLTPKPGINSGFKGMQLSVTSLACAVRQMAGPSLIHSLPTEEYNEDVVSLGMHAAVTAWDALECVCNETAMVLLAAAQAVDLRGAAKGLGGGSRKIYERVRSVAAFQDKDRPMEGEVAALAGKLRSE